MRSRKIAITIWGEIKGDIKEYYFETMMSGLGYEITHLGIETTNYSPKSIVSVKRKEKDMLERIENGEIVKSLECFSLPKDYKQAIFDYEIYSGLHHSNEESFITVVVNEEDYSVDVEELIISIISKYIDADNGEVYACSKEEAIVAYAHFKDTKKCSLETYEFIKNIGYYENR